MTTDVYRSIFVWNSLTIRQLKAAVSHWGGVGFSGDYGRMTKSQMITWLAEQTPERLATMRANNLSNINRSLGLTYDASRVAMAKELSDFLAATIEQPEDEVDELDTAKANLHSTIARIFSTDDEYAQQLVELSN